MFNYYVNSYDDKKVYSLNFLYIFIIGIGHSKQLGRSVTLYFSIAKLQIMFDITLFNMKNNVIIGPKGDA